jgi:hypothetical protein
MCERSKWRATKKNITSIGDRSLQAPQQASLQSIPARDARDALASIVSVDTA